MWVFLCYNEYMQWDLITNIILIAALAIFAVFALLGLFQWITRKSLKKVDRSLLMFPIPLVLMAIVYFVFDKLIVLSTRPNGSGEPSFPSTHVMVVATIFLMAAIIIPRYIKSKTMVIILDILMLALIVLVSMGRILANMHWPTDVAGGLGFAILFAVIYYFIINFSKKEQNE